MRKLRSPIMIAAAIIAGAVIALPIVAASSQSGADASDKGPVLPDYAAEEVAAGVYVIHGPVGYPSPENLGFMNNPAFIVTDEGVVVVDPGSTLQTGEMVLRQLRRVTDKPVLAVFNSHVHGDHWLGNQAIVAEYPDVPIYAHPAMIALVEQGAGQQWEDLMLRATENASRGTVTTPPNQPANHGDEYKIGGLTYKIHHLGHVHTTTDIMIEVPEKAVLFLGDNANNRRIVRMDDGSFVGSIEALGALKDLTSATILVPGHGKTAGWEIVDDYRTYLSGVYGGVEELYDEGIPDYEMKPAIEQRLTQFSDWPGFFEELGKHISLGYLEVENNAF